MSKHFNAECHYCRGFTVPAFLQPCDKCGIDLCPSCSYGDSMPNERGSQNYCEDCWHKIKKGSVVMVNGGRVKSE